MNIGHMASAVIGDKRAMLTEAKGIRLQEGQVVKGVVLQVLEGQEALISVNGTRIKAHLEAPLQSGQSAWLQVQSTDPDGRLYMKVLALNEGTTDDMVTKLLAQLKLQDNSLNRELVRLMQQLGMPIQAKDARALSAFLTRTEHLSANLSNWIQSAIVALHRGLPLTESVVLGIDQTLHGRPLQDHLLTVRQEVSLLLQQGNGQVPGPGARLPEGTRHILTRLVQVIDQWLSQATVQRPGISSTGGNLSGAQIGEQAGGGHSAIQNFAGQAQEQGSRMGITRDGPAAALSSAAPRVGQTSASGHAATAWTNAADTAVANTASSALQRVGTVHTLAAQAAAQHASGNAQSRNGQPHSVPFLTQHTESLINGQSLGQTQIQSQTQSQSSSLSGDGRNQGQVTGGNAVPPLHSDPSVAGSGVSPVNHSVIRQLFQMLGLSHENDLMMNLLMQQSGENQMEKPALGAMNEQTPIVSQQGHPSGGTHQLPVAETVKSLLLQAVSVEHLPAALRESVQQAIQSITGQQLLMTADRSAPLTHVTLFVPLFTEQGEQLASVHVQTRMKGRGQLDSDNCNLLFDLHMANLGDMIIDVQVTERIVSLRIYNDHPLMETLVKAGQEQIREAIDDLGYRLSHMKTMSLGKEPSTSTSEVTPVIGLQTRIRQYAAGNIYKGVDVRV